MGFPTRLHIPYRWNKHKKHSWHPTNPQTILHPHHLTRDIVLLKASPYERMGTRTTTPILWCTDKEMRFKVLLNQFQRVCVGFGQINIKLNISSWFFQRTWQFLRQLKIFLLKFGYFRKLNIPSENHSEEHALMNRHRSLVSRVLHKCEYSSPGYSSKSEEEA